MISVGLVTIGQAPRDDVVPDMSEILGRDVRLVQAGALDGLSRDEMTTRMLAAMDSPYLSIIGHPTGRLLLSRDPYPLDLQAVFEKAGWSLPLYREKLRCSLTPSEIVAKSDSFTGDPLRWATTRFPTTRTAR